MSRERIASVHKNEWRNGHDRACRLCGLDYQSSAVETYNIKASSGACVFSEFDICARCAKSISSAIDGLDTNDPMASASFSVRDPPLIYHVGPSK